jgi:hypothetical protein
MDQSEIFPIRVRSLQADFPQAHQALVEWGSWSRDRKGMAPPPIQPPRIWDEFKPDENESYGEVTEETTIVEQTEVKAERAEDDPYDELQGTILDERMHSPGGLAMEVRNALKVAYVHRYVLEANYPRQAGCSQDAFLERLEAGLRFAQRFL